jgi:uncharacterized protein YrrD
MDTRIQFQKSATILTANGKQVGSLERVVVNPSTCVLTDIVVRTGTLLKQEEKVVPIELVAETNTSQIVLREEAGELKAFPPFEEERLVSENGRTRGSSSPADDARIFVGYPSVGTPVVSASNKPIVTRIEQNIPEGTVAMKEGAKVITAEGKNVGSVERVLADSSVDQITHLLVSRGLFTKEAKLIPIHWVMTMGEDKVHLRVSKDSVEDLGDIPLAS